MAASALSREIIESRREKAPRLQRIIDGCKELSEKLEDVVSAMTSLDEIDAHRMREADEKIRGIQEALEALRKRAALRHDRFSSGLITVAVAGLEKAGKTTFLRSLTGIEALPTFDERCTAVLCEIRYAQGREDFDLEFYTEAEFTDRVLRPLIETVQSALPGDQQRGFSVPGTAAGFSSMSLPPPETLPGGTTAHKLLKDLHRLKNSFGECLKYLGHVPLQRQPLSEMREWVSYPQTMEETADEKARGDRMARVAAAKRCRIHTAFAGGSEHLRWIDTPGVDDPNRRARDMTLATIAADADLLVTASRPGATPSPGESFHRFWDSVSRQPDEIDLMSRLLFALNIDKRVDPEGENIRIHRKYLMDAGVPGHIFVGPFEATNPDDAKGLMKAVNDHLQKNLADQDMAAVDLIEGQLKHIRAQIRLLCDLLAQSHPADASLQEMEDEAFHRWFHWYQAEEDTGFWSDLVEALDRSVRNITEDSRIKDSEAALNAIFAQEAGTIQEKIPKPKDLETYLIRHRGENPIPHGMRTISTHFSKLINKLSGEIQAFGPVMQDELVSVLTEAGLGPLLKGDASSAKLKSLVERFENSAGPNEVTDVLKETLELPRNLKYVLRYELRGAVDFSDPTLWDENETAWSRLVDMITANNGDLERLSTFDTYRHPPVTESREADSDILKRIAGNAMLGVHAVLNNERNLPRRIADDFMRDCRVRLCFAPESEQQWRSLLFRNRAELLSQAIGRIRSSSERIRDFHRAVRGLAAELP